MEGTNDFSGVCKNKFTKNRDVSPMSLKKMIKPSKILNKIQIT